MHGVNDKVRRDGGLGGGEGLRDGGAAIDAAGARGVPEWIGIGICGGGDVGQRVEVEEGFNGGGVGQGRWGFDEGWARFWEVVHCGG